MPKLRVGMPPDLGHPQAGNARDSNRLAVAPVLEMTNDEKLVAKGFDWGCSRYWDAQFAGVAAGGKLA